MCVDHGRTRICSGSPITVAPESDTRSRIHEPASARQFASETMAEKHSLMALSYCSHACDCGCDHMLAVCVRSEEHTSELQSRGHLVCRLVLEKKKQQNEQQLK